MRKNSLKFSTPRAKASTALFGPGPGVDGWILSQSEYRALMKLYGFYQEPVSATSPLIQAGNDRNLLRHATLDGQRMIAWLARYVEPGEDPVKLLIQMAAAYGMDVDPEDIDFSEEEEEEEED